MGVGRKKFEESGVRVGRKKFEESGVGVGRKKFEESESGVGVGKIFLRSRESESGEKVTDSRLL